MKPKMVVTLVGLGALLLGIWLLLAPKREVAGNSAPPASDQKVEVLAGAAQEKPSALISAAPGATGVAAATRPAETTHEAYVAQRVAELGDLAMENDSA